MTGAAKNQFCPYPGCYSRFKYVDSLVDHVESRHGMTLLEARKLSRGD